MEAEGQIRCAAAGRRLGRVQVRADNSSGKGAGCRGCAEMSGRLTGVAFAWIPGPGWISLSLGEAGSLHCALAIYLFSYLCNPLGGRHCCTHFTETTNVWHDHLRSHSLISGPYLNSQSERGDGQVARYCKIWYARCSSRGWPE